MNSKIKNTRNLAPYLKIKLREANYAVAKFKIQRQQLQTRIYSVPPTQHEGTEHSYFNEDRNKSKMQPVVSKEREKVTKNETVAGKIFIEVLFIGTGNSEVSP
ncbi:hypothetical protein CDAR_72431 [Caerostris darwini]|uniref:Uncharacterized protein n=1 Tax=Caerostris darwini TaxID=1538125 RepID=A0AAV4MKS5_9ARAC|nr:hypothetical protein CDAR_72431 [Caerostris darwini]